MAIQRPDEVGVVGVAADPVPDEPEPGEGVLGELALDGYLAGQAAVVDDGLLANKGGIDGGDPPHGLADQRARRQHAACRMMLTNVCSNSHGPNPRPGLRSDRHTATVPASRSR
ncbi:MAG: hypothetical protein ACRDOE_17740, partial [Streptosporangiaceae bacterium]